MSLSGKTDPAPVDNYESADRKQEPEKQRKKTNVLTVAYRQWMKLLIVLPAFLVFPMLAPVLEAGYFAVELFLVGVLGVCLWIAADCLFTLDLTFSPHNIIKRGLFGSIEIPASALLVRTYEQDTRIFYGSEKNLRESFRIYISLISSEDSARIEPYIREVYGVRTDAEGKAVAGEGGPSLLAVSQYEAAASSYRMMAWFFPVFVLVALFTVGVSQTFLGLAPTLPAYPIRLACIAFAIAAFFLLRNWTSTATRPGSNSLVPIMVRLERADSYAFRCATLAVSVAALGLLLFLLFGNTLDYYLFQIVGACYFYECYPRLSTWDQLTAGAAPAEAGTDAGAVLPRRSLQVSLVLMGALAVMSHGESSHYLYANRKDCQDDWGEQNCREIDGGGGSSGSVHYGGGRYYGPRYGSGGGSPTHAVGVGSVRRGGFGSLGGFHASFGG